MEDDDDTFGEAFSRFDHFMFTISCELEASEAKEAALLLRDKLKGRHTSITSAHDLFEELIRIVWVTPNNVDNLRQLLLVLPRRDLIPVLNNYEKTEIDIPSSASGGLRPNVPDKFFGREEEMKAVLDHLTGSTTGPPFFGRLPCVLISGFPGMGKTHLARKAVKELSADTLTFHREILVDLRELTAVESVYFALMSSLGKPAKEFEPAQLVRALQTRKQECVLLLDNADTLLEPGSLQEPNILKGPFLDLLEKITSVHNDKIKLLITSRYIVNDSERKLHLPTEVIDKMAIEDAVSLIEYHMDHSEIKAEDAENLARKCGFHPLAMKIVAARLKSGLVPLKTVIKELDKKPMKALNILEGRELAGLSGAGLVEQCIHSTFSDLPHLLKKSLIFLSVIPGTFDNAAVKDILCSLGSLEVKMQLISLIHRNLIEADVTARRFKMHLLLRSYLQRIAHSEPEFRECRKKAEQLFVMHYNKKLSRLGRLMETDHKKALQKKDVELPNLLAALQMHANSQEVPDQAMYCEIIQFMELIQEESERYNYFSAMAKKAENKGELIQCIFFKSLLLKQMSDLRYSGPELEKETNEIEELLMKVPDNKISPEIQVAHAMFYMYAGEAKVRQGSQNTKLIHDGIELLQRSVEGFKDSLGPVSTWHARANNALGFAYHCASKWEESRHRQHITHALKCFEIALQIRQNINQNHFDTSTYYLNIGACYEALRNKKKALEYYQKALSLDKAIKMSNYAAKGNILWNLSTVYFKMKEYTKALDTVKKYIRVKQREYDEHPYIAKGYAFAGIILLNKKQTKQSRQYLDTALCLEERLMKQGRGPSDLWDKLQKAIKNLCILTDKNVDIPGYQRRFQKAEESKRQAEARLKAGLTLNEDESDSDDSEQSYPRKRKKGKFERALLPVYEPDGSDDENSSDESVDLEQIHNDVQRAQVLGTGSRFGFFSGCHIM